VVIRSPALLDTATRSVHGERVVCEYERRPAVAAPPHARGHRYATPSIQPALNLSASTLPPHMTTHVTSAHPQVRAHPPHSLDADASDRPNPTDLSCICPRWHGSYTP
jgi:hypothetical protein